MKNYIDKTQKCQQANTVLPDYKVRLVADLSAAAFRTKQDKELALWHCLRALNINGSGYLKADQDTFDQLREVFGYSRRTAFRLLSMGEGVFWTRISTKRGSVIKIQGLKSVFLYLNSPMNNTARFYEVEAGRFNTFKRRRLALWASMAKPKGIKCHPVSRASLEDYTGTQRRTQQRRDKESVVKRTACWRPEYEQPRMGNKYHNDQFMMRKGMLPRIRRELKSLMQNEALKRRVYFRSIRNMARTTNKESGCLLYTLTRPRQRQIKGRIEYTPVLLVV